MENDYWKEQLNKYLQINMTKKDKEIIHMDDALEKIQEFSRKFPSVQTELNESSSYIAWEAYINGEVKLRFYIQSQIKISFMQKIDGVFTKVADAKFPYNPFPEIEQLFSNLDNVLQNFSSSKKQSKQSQMQQKITFEFIKALVKNKFENKVIYNIDCRDEDFLLTLENYENDRKEIVLNRNNFRQIIREL